MSWRDSPDVLVVGAGIAGPVLARELAKAGVRVTLVERATFPRAKVCGCCLNPSALASLDAVGLGDVPQQLGAVPLRELCWSHGRASARVEVSGVAVSRERFDAELVRRAIGAGVTFADGVEVHCGPDGVILRRGGERCVVRPRFLVAANGLLGAAGLGLAAKPRIDRRSWIGAGVVLADAPPTFGAGVIWMASGRGGYVGAVRVERGHFDVAAALDPALVKRCGGLAPAAAWLWAKTGWPLPDFTAVKWRGTPPLTRTAARLAGPGWLAVGDGCGYVEPFTGEGMAWALLSARLAVPHVLAALAGRPTDWPANYRRVIRPRQRVCRLVAGGLRSGWLAGAAARLLGAFPGAARPAVHAIGKAACLT